MRMVLAHLIFCRSVIQGMFKNIVWNPSILFLGQFWDKFTKKESQKQMNFHARYIKIHTCDNMSQKESEPQRVKGWKIPLSCPNCTSTLSIEGYARLSKMLKPRYWHNCDHCGFKRDVYDFKRELLTIWLNPVKD